MPCFQVQQIQYCQDCGCIKPRHCKNWLPVVIGPFSCSRQQNDPFHHRLVGKGSRTPERVSYHPAYTGTVCAANHGVSKACRLVAPDTAVTGDMVVTPDAAVTPDESNESSGYFESVMDSILILWGFQQCFRGQQSSHCRSLKTQPPAPPVAQKQPSPSLRPKYRTAP